MIDCAPPDQAMNATLKLTPKVPSLTSDAAKACFGSHVRSPEIARRWRLRTSSLPPSYQLIRRAVVCRLKLNLSRTKFIHKVVIIGPVPTSLVMRYSTRRRNLQVALREEPPIAIQPDLELAFRSHHGLVFRTAYRITGNAADAEDVLQAVFLRLLRRGSSGGAVEKEESYLRRAAINASLDIIRSRHADRTVELPEDLQHKETPDLRRALQSALAQLDARPAEIFTLRFLEGFTNSQIAKMLGISQVLVAVIVHRTRKQLRHQLAGYLGDRP
jgi:RNA polymerase sigma-70 factor (ECF subfamily)